MSAGARTRGDKREIKLEKRDTKAIPVEWDPLTSLSRTWGIRVFVSPLFRVFSARPPPLGIHTSPLAAVVSFETGCERPRVFRVDFDLSD